MNPFRTFLATMRFNMKSLTLSGFFLLISILQPLIFADQHRSESNQLICVYLRQSLAYFAAAAILRNISVRAGSTFSSRS